MTGTLLGRRGAHRHGHVYGHPRGFTALSASGLQLPVLNWLNRYLTAMDKVIRHHGGFLNKFIGDGLMIIFGLPLSQGPKDDATRAVQASWRCWNRVELLNKEQSGQSGASPTCV